MNLTIFTIPKAFGDGSTHDRTTIHQTNAVSTWLRLPTSPEVILCGNDPGVVEAAEKLDVQHLPDIRCTPKGTPLLDDAFAQVHKRATGSVLAYVNADIMLMPDFISAVERATEEHSRFLMLGRRWNLDAEELIDFEREDWRSHLLEKLQQYGTFSGIGALDYFVFPKPLFEQLPPFAVGRAGWDNWMVGEALSQEYPVVNASQVVTVIHQNHDYGHLPGKRLEAFHGTEAKQNRTFLKGHLAGSSANATHVLRNQKSASGRSSEAVESCDAPRVSIILASSDKDMLSELEPQVGSAAEVISVGGEAVAAWNRGLAEAQGEFVLFLEEGTCLLPGAIASWLEQADTRAGSLEMVFAGWQVAKGDTKVEPWHELGHLLSGREGIQGFHIWSLPTIWPLLHPSTVLVRRDWLERFGTLKEGLQPKAAVIDLVLRLFSRGAAAVYLEAPVLSYRATEAQEDKVPSSEIDRMIDEDCRQILEGFFQQSHIPKWSYSLKGHAQQTVEDWLKQS